VVRAIHWDGVHVLTTGALEDHIFTQTRPWWRLWKPLPPFDPLTLEQDVARIEAYYRSQGHFEAHARSEVRRSANGRSVTIVFHVGEGPAVRLVARTISVPPLAGRPADDPAWTRDLPFAPGEVFTLDRYGAAKRELLARVADAGHPRARILGGADVDVATRSARIHWQVEPGPEVRFGPVRVEGLERVREKLVRREVTIREGEPFSVTALRKTREQVQGLGVFGSVIVQPAPNAARHEQGHLEWPVDVRVYERPPRSIELGVGWGTEDELRLQGRWIHRNVFGNAERLQATARYSSLVREVRADFTRPHFLGAGQSFDVRTSLGRDVLRAYDAERIVASLGVTRAFREHWTASAAYEASWASITDSTGAADRFVHHPDRQVVLSGFRMRLERVTVDDRLDPHHGSWLTLAVAPWFPALGSEEGFVSTVAEARAYQPLHRTVLAARLRVGSLTPYAGSGDRDIPMTERFYLGGAGSMRGFSYQGLGPSDASGKPVGGTSLLAGSLEWRFPVYKALGGVVFTDAGEVGLHSNRWDLADLVYSVGVGLRYATPLGPLRLDLALPLNPPHGASTSFVYFSIGQAF
jgi:outer membrane protein assembly complex protein YaeT